MTDYRAEFSLKKNTLELDSSINNTTLEFTGDIHQTINVYDKHYTHEQGIASDAWTIHHNLNKKPSITIVDSADTRITGFKAEYIDLNTVIVSFNGGFTGKAYLN